MYSCMVHSPPPVPISPSGSHCHSATSSWGYHLLGQCLHWSGTTLFLCLSQSCSLSLVLNLPLLLQYLLYSEHVLILILFPVQNREQFQRSYHGLRLLMLSATISWLTLGVASLIRTLNTWVGNYTRFCTGKRIRIKTCSLYSRYCSSRGRLRTREREQDWLRQRNSVVPLQWRHCPRRW